MIRAFLKRNGILMIALAVYVAGVLGIASVVDNQVYRQKKRDLVNYQLDTAELLPEQEEARLLAGQWNAAAAKGEAGLADGERLRMEFLAAAERIVQSGSCVFHITLLNATGGVVAEAANEAKVPGLNDRRNSLWNRRFELTRKLPLSRAGGKRGLGAAYVIQFTTPWPGPEDYHAALVSLTRHYWFVTWAAIFLYTLFCAAVVVWILLPMRNVTSCIEESTAERVKLVRRPRSNLERLYNAMARETALARLQERLLERVGEGAALAPWELAREACEIVVVQGAATAAACVEIEEAPGAAPRWTGRRSLARDSRALASVDESTLGEALAGALSKPNAKTAMSNPFERIFSAQEAADAERAGVRYGLAISLARSERDAKPPATDDLAARFAATVRAALEALAARNRTLVRERDRASINLSRSLGHDLTNIIATSKLELMTLGQILRDGAAPIEGQRREILSQSLAALLNSIKFLQEVVNLYRAYAFLKEPTFESADPNALIAETIELFQLSTSQKGLFAERLDPAAPRFRVDPRLFKLALFNLFSNALDAIRREGGQGRIEISTGSAEANGSGRAGLAISVRDNGTGIRNEAGALAAPEEIERIFELGFTLGRGKEGEGLGLNWVRTIVQDIHGGAIKADNHPEGGARFRLLFPGLSDEEEQPTTETQRHRD